MTVEPTSTRRLVADELARLRAMAGISGRSLAARLGVSQPTIVRTEAGDRLPTLPLARAWLEAVDADVRTRDTVLSLVETGHSETVTYRRMRRDPGHLQGHVAELEQRAARIYSMNGLIVPGLLQEPNYARRVMRLADTENIIDHTAALAARLHRQELLAEPGREFSFVILEHALRSPLIDRPQLHHLADLATAHEHVTIGIVAADKPWPAIPWNGVNLYVLDDGSRVAYVELTHGEATVTEPDDLDVYERLHGRWLSEAVVGAEAAAWCRRLAESAGSAEGG